MANAVPTKSRRLARHG